jgi:hypothetical protein
MHHKSKMSKRIEARKPSEIPVAARPDTDEPVPVPAVGTSLALSSDEVAEMKKLNQDAVDAKIAIADLTITKLDCDERIAQQRQALSAIQAVIQTKAADAMKRHGLDPARVDIGQWRCDFLDEGILRRER